jgi:hypothetical protein
MMPTSPPPPPAGPQGICNKLPGCQFVPLMKECMPKDFDSKPLADLQGINRAFNTVEATTWGSCEGACYVKQVGVTVRCAVTVPESSGAQQAGLGLTGPGRDRG